MVKANELKIPFWTKHTGNLLSHPNGLTEEQVESLKQLRVGDRLIIWDEHPENSHLEYPMTHKLRLFTK